MGRNDSIGEIMAQLDKLDDEELEYLSHWSMPLGVLPLLHAFEDGKLMRDVDCDTHVLLECQERDELIRDMFDAQVNGATCMNLETGERFVFGHDAEVIDGWKERMKALGIEVDDDR